MGYFTSGPYYGSDVAGAPLGIAQAFENAIKSYGRPSAASTAPPIAPAPPPGAPPQTTFPWLGVAMIVGAGALGAFLIYRASSAAEKYAGPIHKYAGRAAGVMAGARYGKSLGAIAALTPGRNGEKKLLPEKGGEIVVSPGDYKLLTA
jgi:hypothetical protein